MARLIPHTKTSGQTTGRLIPHTQKGVQPEKPGGDGFWHTLSQVGGQTFKDLEQTAVSSPAGLYHLGGGLIHHPVRTGRQFGTAVYHQLGQDIHHPLRHPGLTLLDLLGAASLGGGAAVRVAAGARAARAGEAGAAVRALVTRPLYERTVAGVTLPASANPILRGAKTVRVARLEKKAAAGSGEAALKLAKASRKGVKRQVALRQTVESAQHAAVVALGKRLSAPQLQAFRVVADGRPVHEVMHLHESRVAELKGEGTAAARKEIRRHQAVLKNLVQAQRYVKTVDGKPVFRADAKARGGRTLQHVYEQAVKSAGSRERVLTSLNLITEQGLATRKAAAGKIIAGEAAGPNIGGLYISEAQRRGPFGQTVLSVRGAVGRPAKPPGLTRAYTGASKLQALETKNPVTRVGEQGLEAQRFGSAVQMRDILAEHGHPAPLTANLADWRFLRTHSAELPVQLKQVIQKAEQGERLSSDELGFIDRAKRAFAEQVLQQPDKLSADDYQQLLDLAEQGHGVFVPRVLTKEFEQFYSRAVTLIGKKPVSAVDATNNATKLAILYLKVAYAVPNLLGNVALLLAQQGFLAPVNLARTTVFARKIHPDTWARIHVLMGQGLSTSLADSRGLMSGAVQHSANLWSKIVDDRLRLAAFVHEARRVGAKTAEQLERLVSGDDPRLALVAPRANAAIIDYGHLSTREQEVFRRLIFFYPWVKGSTLYAGHLLSEHSAQAAFLGLEGQQGAQAQAPLGPLPSWARQIFPVGERNGQPLTLNPAAASILGTPADLAATVAALAQGHPGTAFQGSSMFTPALQILLSAATHRDNLGRPLQGSLAGGIARDQIRGVPLYQLVQGMRGQLPPSKAYPNMTGRDYLLRYLIGGLAKRPTSPAALNQSAYYEQHPR